MDAGSSGDGGDLLEDAGRPDAAPPADAGDPDGGQAPDAQPPDSGPQHTILNADVANPESCSAACSAQGMTCDDNYDWALAVGGTLLDYDGQCGFVETCAHVPLSTITDCFGPGPYPLTRQRCACL